MNPRDRSFAGHYKMASVLRSVWIAIGVVCITAAQSNGLIRVEGQAPPDSALLKPTRGGYFVVSKPLKERYDGLLAQVQSLQADLDAERTSGEEAMSRLQSLQVELKSLREEIEREKVLVSPVKVHRQSETTTFELGPAKLLVITADYVRVEGWEGPQVKCVLEKTVLAPDDKPVDEQLKGIKLVHRHGLADLAGENARPRVPSEIAARLDLYRTFHGKQIDTLEIEGLTIEQGNQQIGIDIQLTSRTKMTHNAFQRYASLTVYVPACEAMALRGCLGSLDVRGVQGALLVTPDGSQDRNYDGTFEIRDVRGSLTVENAPLDLVEAIHGNVLIRSTTEMVDSGMHYEKGRQTHIASAPRALTCRKIDGDLTAWFTRSNLRLEAVAGRIDVRNEFGNTTLVVGPGLAKKPHRVVSEAGWIELQVMPKTLEQLSLSALTNCGSIRTNAAQEVLHYVSTQGRDPAGVSRDWCGLVSGPDSPDGFGFMDRTVLVDAVLEGKDRPPGLDLISRGGAVRVTLEGAGR